MDLSLSLWIHEHIPPLSCFKFASILIAPANWIILWIILSVICFHKSLQKHLPFCLQFLAMMLLAFGLAGILKIVVGKARPDYFFETGFYGYLPFHGFSHAFRSFPSSHSATAFGLVTLFVILKHPRWWISLILYLFAISLAASRLFLECHYLSDVLAGAFLGISCALIIKKIGQVIHLPDQIKKLLK